MNKRVMLLISSLFGLVVTISCLWLGWQIKSTFVLMYILSLVCFTMLMLSIRHLVGLIFKKPLKNERRHAKILAASLIIVSLVSLKGYLNLREEQKIIATNKAEMSWIDVDWVRTNGLRGFLRDEDLLNLKTAYEYEYEERRQLSQAEKFLLGMEEVSFDDVDYVDLNSAITEIAILYIYQSNAQYADLVDWIEDEKWQQEVYWDGEPWE